MKYKKFSDLTVGEAQQLYEVARSDDDELDKSINYVSIITGKPRWEVEEIEIQTYKNICKEAAIILTGNFIPLKPLTSVKIGGRKYRITYKAKDLSAGQYIDIQHFLKGNMIENMHNIFACIVVEKSWWSKQKYDGSRHEIVAEAIRDMNFVEIHSACVFFCNLWSSYIEATRVYLESQLKKSGMSLSSLSSMDLQQLLAGYITQSV